ncbi:MAG: glycerophosphodiester phosphodiesterase [Thermoanaerobaculia bacterium]
MSFFSRNRAPFILAHRGASGEFPENTLASFREAVRQRADAIELDLQLTSDGHLVASHDRNLRRVSGHAVVVEDTAFHVLRHLSVSRRFPGLGKIVIPSLEEIFEALPPEFPLNLDLKCRRAGRRRFADALARRIEGRGHLLLSSFNWVLLGEIRRRLAGVEIMPAVHRKFGGAVRFAESANAPAVAAHHKFLRRRFLRAADAKNLAVLAFTVNDSAEALRLLRLGVSGFFTNFPRRLRAGLQT